MNYKMTRTRRIAFALLLIWCYELSFPAVSLALTSGPVQPEVNGFQPASTSDMVDLSTGDFKYNIPLLDIDGYPVNLNYQSGVSMDDEASWVGLGWNLNVGSINRNMRGIPDDMDGDLMVTDHYTKPKVTVGGMVRAKAEVFSIPVTGSPGGSSNGSSGGSSGGGSGGTSGGSSSGSKNSKIGKTLLSLGGSVSVGIFNDNYTGIGGEVGINPSITVLGNSSSKLTASLGMGILSNTQSGVEVSPSANIGFRDQMTDKKTVSAGLSTGIGYNSRSGMKSLTLGASYSNAHTSVNLISFNTEPVQPRIQVPYLTTNSTFSFDMGFTGFPFFAGGGGSGYKTVTEVAQRNIATPAYGFLYAEHGKNLPNAQMDFIREKDNPIIKELPNLAVPVAMPDIYSFTSQTGSGQFRLFRGGTGVFFDRDCADFNANTTFGFDLGAGAVAHGGPTIYDQEGTNITQKWVKDNNYLATGDFQDPDYSNPGNQHVYFKETSSLNQEDRDMVTQLNGTNPLAVQLSSTTALNNFSGYAPASAIQKHNREPGKTNIAYLTAGEASGFGLETGIKSYPFNDEGSSVPLTNKPAPNLVIPRVSSYRKKSHFSQFTVTDEGGKRMVYGLPVYQAEQDEYSFAIVNRTPGNQLGYTVAPNTEDQYPLPAGTTESTLGQNCGIDHYYHKEKQPAYATSFLLTAVLSPDYVDKTGDGISDDDLGTAIKFNYSTALNSSNPSVPALYHWRTPFQNATINRGQLADADDDKASIVYGEKELWYISSIESKTKIAYFITEDRQDGLGATNFLGGVDQSVHQKRLREIRLYSKADMTKPIKVVKFVYDYSLCPNTPNSLADGQGKLTLRQVYFEYGNTTKGQHFPYTFNYNTTYQNAGGTTNSNVGYHTMSTDRWGVYKDPTDNTTSFNLRNDEFPYTLQNLNGDGSFATRSAQAASLWHLSSINLPTGGTINVNYEADDYAYVQDKKAMVMTPVADLIDGNGGSSAGLVKAKGVKIKIDPTPDNANATAWFKQNYLNGSNYLYGKFYTKMSTSYSNSYGQDYDFVSCYAEIASVSIANNYAKIIFVDRKDGDLAANPVAFTAWQMLKDEYPRYAYRGFDNRIGDASLLQNVENAVRAIITAVSNISDLTTNIYQKGFNKGFADVVQLNKSFVRIVKQDGHKVGGGARVSKIMISDDWNEMTGNNLKTYGQAYTYTTVEDGKVISSGVATNEPMLGGDENPLRQPVPYVEHIKGAVDNFFDLEEPFGESYFPAPAVIYGKVTVTDLDDTQKADPMLQTGYVTNEFYTAKDFPVKVNVLNIQPYENQPNTKYGIIETNSVDELAMSQGYAIILNDMPGKVKGTAVYNQAGALVSSVSYGYNTTAANNGPVTLSNNVSVVNRDGTVTPNQVIGRDIEFYTDCREQVSNTDGTSIDLGFDFLPIWDIPIPDGLTPENNEHKTFRSICGVKVVTYHGIVDHVTKYTNGSSITTQNLAYDAITGDPVVTQTQNEFNNNIYSVNVPAYWTYPGMGPAYQSQGVIFANFSTSASGIIDPAFAKYLSPGDELVDINSANSANHYWVIQQYAVPDGSGAMVHDAPVPGLVLTKLLYDRYGRIQKSQNFTKLKVVRSGNRNLLADNAASLVCLNNPIIANATGTGYRLALDNSDLTALKVINASAKTYDENWASEIPDIHLVSGGSSYDFTVWSGSAVNAPNGTYLMTLMDYPTSPESPTPSNSTFTASLEHTPENYLGNGYFDSELVNCAILDHNQALISPNNNNTMGFATSFNVPAEGFYYVGYDSNINMSFKFDCNSDWVGYLTHNTAGYMGWNLLPYYFTKGLHTLEIEFTYKGYNPASIKPGASYGAGGIEIYNNNEDELKQIQSSGVPNGLNIIFSTKSLRGTAPAAMYVNTGTQTFYRSMYLDAIGTGFTPCNTPLGSINPYIYGFYGNWRPYQSLVFQQNRVYNNIINGNNSKVDIKNAGYLSNFYGYWQMPTAGATAWTQSTSPNWIVANTVKLYDKYGQELENKDALGRFSAAEFDFNGELPGAVASNAQNREIYVTSFEDISFIPGAYTFLDAPPTPEFVDAAGNTLKSKANTTDAHAGNYSAAIPAGGVSLTTYCYNGEQKTQNYLSSDNQYQFIKNTSAPAGIYPNGFEPVPGKQYVFNAWVKDNHPTDNSVNLNLNVGASSTTMAPVSLKFKALVEGWKLLEGVITIPPVPSGSTNNIGSVTISLVPKGGATVLIDDIRIHPFDSQLKSYAYDASTMRLMAELDENGFATFYEYDSEGLLVRVKKETQRGIMTLKESRSSHKRIL